MKAAPAGGPGGVGWKVGLYVGWRGLGLKRRVRVPVLAVRHRRFLELSPVPGLGPAAPAVQGLRGGGRGPDRTRRRGARAGLNTMRLEFSGPLSTKRFAFSIQAL